MDNLIKIRKLANVSPKILSKLLNVTVHTYIAFEQERMIMPKEILKMLSLVFRIDEETIFDSSKQLSDKDTEQLIKISLLSDEEKLKYLASGILEENITINYRNISNIKRKIRNACQ